MARNRNGNPSHSRIRCDHRCRDGFELMDRNKYENHRINKNIAICRDGQELDEEDAAGTIRNSQVCWITHHITSFQHHCCHNSQLGTFSRRQDQDDTSVLASIFQFRPRQPFEQDSLYFALPAPRDAAPSGEEIVWGWLGVAECEVVGWVLTF